MLLCPDNIECMGEGFLEQARFCHYEFANDESSELHEVCLPTAVLVLQRGNITPLEEGTYGEDPFCTCKFRVGKRVCLDGELLCYMCTRCTQVHYASRSFMGACMTKGYSSLQKYTEARRMV